MFEMRIILSKFRRGTSSTFISPLNKKWMIFSMTILLTSHCLMSTQLSLPSTKFSLISMDAKYSLLAIKIS